VLLGGGFGAAGYERDGEESGHRGKVSSGDRTDAGYSKV
jgi:hypothetical protein